MENNAIEKNEISAQPLNRWAYGALLLAGLLSLAFKDWTLAVVLTATSLGFDPFNPKQSWSLRPVWQRLWLIIHLMIVMGLLVADFFITK